MIVPFFWLSAGLPRCGQLKKVDWSLIEKANTAEYANDQASTGRQASAVGPALST
jgi:hypothetical protein